MTQKEALIHLYDGLNVFAWFPTGLLDMASRCAINYYRLQTNHTMQLALLTFTVPLQYTVAMLDHRLD